MIQKLPLVVTAHITKGNTVGRSFGSAARASARRMSPEMGLRVGAGIVNRGLADLTHLRGRGSRRLPAVSRAELPVAFAAEVLAESRVPDHETLEAFEVSNSQMIGSALRAHIHIVRARGTRGPY